MTVPAAARRAVSVVARSGEAVISTRWDLVLYWSRTHHRIAAQVVASANWR